MNKFPLPPEHISPDGHQIWGWAKAFSDALHQEAEIRRLRHEILRVGKRCGDCDKWMKSNQCPREHNVSGYSRGPSSGDGICKQFIETNAARKWRDELSLKLQELEANP